MNGSTSELMRSRGVTGLIDQLALWLERAALTQLIDPTQGWEPVRRDRFDDYVVADPNFLRRLVEPRSDCRVLTSRFLSVRDGGEANHVVVVDAGGAKIDEGLPRRWSDERNMSCLTFVAWSGKRASGEPFVADRYLPKSIVDVRGLLERAAQLGCGEQLPSKLGLLELRLRGCRLSRPVPIAIVLIPRRPCDVIGQGSPLEICPYLVELKGRDDLGARSPKPVRISAHFDTVSTSLLRRAAGEAPTEDAVPWTIVGCGSVGSKLAVHIARTGRAPSLVVDRSPMRPHNLARHALLPVSHLESALMPSKATALCRAILALGQPAKDVCLDVLPALARGNSAEIAPAGTRLIVNATGSLTVRETLCKSGLSRPRVIESCLMGAGRIAYMSVEGAGANPSSLDLVTEAYVLIGQDEEMRAVAFSAPPVEIDVGAGCSSLTFPMSDARLSALTAPMAEHLDRLLGEKEPSSFGELLIGFNAEDGLGQRWSRRRIAPFIEVGSEKASVRVSAAVHLRIEQEVASKPERKPAA